MHATTETLTFALRVTRKRWIKRLGPTRRLAMYSAPELRLSAAQLRRAKIDAGDVVSVASPRPGVITIIKVP